MFRAAPLFMLMALCAGGRAQMDTLTLPFRALTIEDGLSQGMVNNIIQDKYGFMWFATKDGLNRYDGYTFTVYRHDPGDSGTVQHNYIYSLLEDRQGRLWVGTGTGLDLFDRSSETFLHVQAGSSFIKDIVHTIAQDANDDLWVSHNNGVVKLTFTGAIGNDGMPACTSKNVLDRTCFVSSDRAGNVWVGQLDLAGFRILPDHNGSDVVDTLHLDRPAGNARTGRSMTDLTGLTIVEDTIGRRIYGLHMFGIVEIDARSARVHSLIELGDQLGEMRGANAALDAKGRLWISVFTGIYVFDPATRVLSRVLPSDPNLLRSANRAKCAYRDTNGLIWMGTTGYGIFTYEPREGRFHTVASGSCGAMRPLRNGRVFVTFYDGFVNEFDPRTRTWPVWVPGASKNDHPELHMLNRATKSMQQDERGLYWFNHAGILTYDIKRDRIVRFPRDRLAVAAYPEETYHEALFLEGDSNIWSGTATTLCRFDRRTLTYHHVPFPRTRRGDTEQFLHVIHRAPDGTLWLGTSAGLFRYERNAKAGTDPWKVYINDPSASASISTDIVYTIAADPLEPHHVLWIGTNGGGLNRLDSRTGEFRRYSMRNGLPNDVVYGILSDERGCLWMSTNKGIARFDPRNGSFRNYDASDGLQSDEFNRYAYCKQADGTLFFGGVRGFNYFKPEGLEDDSSASAIRITGIKLINKAVDHRAVGSPLNAPAYLSDGMTIPHSTNMVTFEFASMEFSAPNEHRYQYMMEGFDTDWIMAGTDRSAVYTNLDPGSYTFRVRGDNRDGIWDGRGTSFLLTVLPPWYRTWWFYAIAVIALGGAVWWYLRSLRERNRKLERTVAQRTVELVAAKDRAEHSEQVKQQFLANMSHEIRTPMNAIMGLTNILRRGVHSPVETAQLNAIASSSEHLLVIVNDILDLSKIEAGKLDLEKVEMGPQEQLEHVLDVMRYRAEEKGLTLAMEIAPDVPDTVIGDPTRLDQVLINLVGNAIKFTAHGTVRVRLDVTQHVQNPPLSSTRSVDPNGERTGEVVGIHYTITDTGVGIAPDRIGRIFEEFTQAETDHSRKFGGTGLGLAISKRLVEMQGGSIKVESEAGKGSTFSVTIPYAIAAVEAHTTARTSANSHHGARQGATPLRILLAEDHPLNVMVAQAELAEVYPNATVDVAENGERALEMASMTDYDLVLMDVQMPVMDGYEAARAIRALAGGRSRVPIIAMTANVMEAEVERCKQEGMDGFIPKPFEQEELAAAIQQVL
ncbi:MAG: response regulator [Flavobacteriales bacterium]|nr:response regulator [Flavobacteriales bacterium]